MYMEIPCSHRIDILATASQHFECLTGGVWKEPGSWNRQCLGLSDSGFGSSCLELGSQDWGLWTGSCGCCCHVSSLPPIFFIMPSPNPRVQSFAGHPLLFCSSPHVSPPAWSLPIQGPPLPTARAPKEGCCKMKTVLFQLFLPQMQAPETREAPGACGSECVCVPAWKGTTLHSRVADLMLV